jgi:hypothetical protein
MATTAKKKLARIEKRIAKRDELWPDASQVTWTKAKEGWVPLLPRILPLVAGLANRLAPKGKGDPGLTYLDLWFRSDEGDSFARILREDHMAAGVGFTGRRMVRTWNERMQTLEDLNLVRLQRTKGTGRIAAVLLLDPIKAVESLLETRNDIPVEWQEAWRDRVDDAHTAPT